MRSPVTGRVPRRAVIGASAALIAQYQDAVQRLGDLTRQALPVDPVEARRLRAAGIDVTAVRYAGVCHDLMMLNALAETNANRAATAQTARALKTALLARP